MMVSRCIAWGGRQSVRALILLGLAWPGLGLAQVPPGGGGAALPPLPAVQDEVAGSVDTPAASPAAPAGSPAPAPGSVAPTSASASGRFASVADAKDKLREAFAARNYSAVLGLAEEIRRQFPGETFMRYYETSARLQLQSGNGDPTKLPYQRLDTLPSSRPSGQPDQAAARATPAPTPALTPQTTPAPSPRATPVRTPVAVAATEPVATPVTLKMRWNQVLDALDDQKLYLLGGAGLLAIVALTVVLVRRGKRDEEESGEDPVDVFGAETVAPSHAAGNGNGNGNGNGEVAIQREYPISPDMATPVFRSEVHALATAGPSVFAPPEVELDFEDELEVEAEPEAEPEPPPAFKAAPPPEPRAEFNPDQIFFHPAEEPAFELALEAEAEPEPGPLHELAPLGVADPPALAPGGPPAAPSDLLVIDQLSQEEPEPDGWSRPAAPPELLDERPFKLIDDETPQPEAPQPIFTSGSIAESLVIGEDEEPFEFPKGFTPQPAPELVLPGFNFAGDGPAAPPAEAEPSDLPAAPLTAAAAEEYDPVAFAAEETQTEFPGLRGGEATLGSPAGEETTGRQEGAPAEEPEFQAFRPGETVTIHVDADEAFDDAAEQTMISPMPTAEEENKTVDALDSSADVFEREYRQGLKDMEARNWVGAIHHLSIAAALRPGAFEVKDKLREARRMRAKELEGRA